MSSELPRRDEWVHLRLDVDGMIQEAFGDTHALFGVFTPCAIPPRLHRAGRARESAGVAQPAEHGAGSTTHRPLQTGQPQRRSV